MKKTIPILISILLLLSVIPARIFAESQTQSTTIRYSVSATVIYEEYDGTRTIQKVDVGTTLKEPAHKGKDGCTFLGWKDEETGEFWDFRATVERNLTLIACYQDPPKSLETGDVTLGEALLYNGTLQTQEVVKVTLDGEELPTDAYTVENNTQTEPGSYTLTIRAVEGSGYTGTLTWSWVIAPVEESQIQEDENGDVKIGKGDLSIEVKAESEVSDVTIETDKSSFIENLIESDSITADELSDVADGASIDIVVVVKDGTNLVSEEAKNLMEMEASDYDIVRYIDISLYKYVYIDGENEVTQQIHETAGMLTISIQVPDSMINTDENIERTYVIVRNHEGDVEILNCSYDETTHILTFQTNQFSDYAIAYKDKQKSSGDNNQSGNGSQNGNQQDNNQPGSGSQNGNHQGNNQPGNGSQNGNQQDNNQSGNGSQNDGQQNGNQSGNTSQNVSQTSTPKTGDPTDLSAMILLLATSLTVILIILKEKRKQL